MPPRSDPTAGRAGLRFAKPEPSEIDALLTSDALEFSYPEQGATRDCTAARPASIPRRYHYDHYAFEIGAGEEVFRSASQALRTWAHFRIPWLEFHGIEEPVLEGCNVASLVPVMGFWFLNPCRVVYADFDSAGVHAFAYGTLQGHAARGEERFRLAIDADTGGVRYEITAFSHPAHWAARLAAPRARRIQQRFAADSAAALRAAIAS